MCFHSLLMCKSLSTLMWNVHNILKNNYTVTRLRLSYGIREMVYSLASDSPFPNHMLPNASRKVVKTLSIDTILYSDSKMLMHCSF